MKYKAYASVYKIADEGRIKTNMIVVVKENGELLDYIPGPITIDEYEGRFTEKKAKISVQGYVKEEMSVKVELENIELMTYEDLGRLLFKLENK